MVFCFGELLLRMSPVLDRQWLREAAMPVYIGGAELNVATALAGWKIPVRYFTALPANYLSNEIIAEIAAKNIDTSAIHMSGNRVGVYLLPQGTDLKNAGVIYDRAHSSFSELRPGIINWIEVLKDCTWFHFSAISPALTQNVADLCAEALMAAKSMGIRISVDLNYRAKLWQYGKQPVEVMPALVRYCDTVMGNMWAVGSLLGIPSPLGESAGKSKVDLMTAAKLSLDAVQQAYPDVSTIAYTFRLENVYWAMLKNGADIVLSKEYLPGATVDQVGSGDCFMAGLIYGLMNVHAAQDTINFAGAAAVGKLQEKGDATKQTIEDVKKIINA